MGSSLSAALASCALSRPGGLPSSSSGVASREASGGALLEELPRLSPGALRQAFWRGRNKAVGPDGWAGSGLCLLPGAALARVCAVLELVE
eukprot:9953674-Alexandrium_andersonii.AAC.1